MSDPKSALSRRGFMGATGTAAGLAATSRLAAQTTGAASGKANGPFLLTTWDFGPGANEEGWPILADGG